MPKTDAEEVMAGMAELFQQIKDKKMTIDPNLRKRIDVVNEGNKIVLPEKMSFSSAISVLTLKMKEEETEVSIYEEVDTYPLDGAFAFMKAMNQTYGWASPVAIPPKGFFDSEKPPVMVDVEIGYGEHAQVIWGGFQIPGITGLLETSADWDGKKAKFIIKGKVKKKHQAEIKALADLTRDLVAKESIYKGKAIILKTSDEGKLDVENPPGFLDLSRINPDELVFPKEIMAQVNINLFTPIERTAECRKNKIPLKRGVLLEGPYGTGKTLTAYVTAKKCADNGWTFVYLDRVTALRDALLFAKRYAPAVIFAEDIDRVIEGSRSISGDDILNNIDGIGSKNAEIITILTTNHVDRIQQAMLRPGRLDAVISVQPPDSEAAQQLVRLYARELLAEKEDLTEAGKILDGQIPAVIREVVERSKLYAISRIKTGEPVKLKGKDLALSAQGMKAHLALLNRPLEKADTPEEAAGKSIGKLLGHIVTPQTERVLAVINDNSKD